MTSRLNQKLLLAAALTAVSLTVQAAPQVTITFDNWIFGTVGDASRNVGNPGSKSDDYDNVTLYFKDESNQITKIGASAGRFVGTASDLKGISEEVFYAGVDNVLMYCYDIFQPISGGQSVVYDVDFNGVANTTLQFLDGVNRVLSSGNSYDPYAWTKPLSGHQAAAIQVGIWESLYERASQWSYNQSGSESFWVTGLDSLTQKSLTAFLDARVENSALDPAFTMVFTHDKFQDMITADPPLQVPEPGVLALLGGSLLGLGWMRRRRS